MDILPPSIWKGQLFHLVGHIFLLVLVWQWWIYIGEPHAILFWVCIIIPLLHQAYVWITWRLELNNGVVSKTIGFRGYLIPFFILLLARPLSLLFLATIDSGSLGLSISIRVILTFLFLLPPIYTMYSVKNYFGFYRAAGADHFYKEYRDLPLEKRGIFKYTSNGMYLFGFFILWTISIGFNSESSMLIACFSHVSIWLHYYATEKPDMNYLYVKED